MSKLYTLKEVRLFEAAHTALREGGLFTKALTQLPYAKTSQVDNFGGHNYGFFMWQAGREDMLEQVIEIAQGADDGEEILRKLIALRAQQALDAEAELKKTSETGS